MVNYISINDIVNDYLVLRDSSDNDKNLNKTQLAILAKKALREMQYDTSTRIKAVSLTVAEGTNFVPLPDDFLSYRRIGVLGSDCKIYALGQNDRINISDAQCTPSQGDSLSGFGQDYYFSNFYHGGSSGKLYGVGGGNNERGEYRINLEENKIELDLNLLTESIVLEYYADNSISSDPTIHVYMEEAVMDYMYFKSISKKSNVSGTEKQLAKRNWDLSRKLARARVLSFTDTEFLALANKNTQQAIKIAKSS